MSESKPLVKDRISLRHAWPMSMFELYRQSFRLSDKGCRSASPFLVGWRHRSDKARINAWLFKDVKAIERDGEYVPRENDGIRGSFRAKIADDLYFRTKFNQGQVSSAKLAIHYV